jgi:hypothetical protein
MQLKPMPKPSPKPTRVAPTSRASILTPRGRSHALTPPHATVAHGRPTLLKACMVLQVDRMGLVFGLQIDRMSNILSLQIDKTGTFMVCKLTKRRYNRYT